MVSVYLSKKELQIIHDALGYLQDTEYLWIDNDYKERTDDEIEEARVHYEKLQFKIYCKKIRG